MLRLSRPAIGTTVGMVPVGLACAVALGLMAAVANPVSSQEVPEVYQVRGDATLDVQGPRTRRGPRWQHEIPGRFGAELQVDADGAVRIGRITIRVGDVTVTRGRRRVYRFRCNRATTDGPMTGVVDAAGNLLIPHDAASFVLASFSQRADDGGCPGSGDLSILEATNSRPLNGWHDPAADLFQLSGRFRAHYDDEDIHIDVALEGHYENRPPVAELGVEGEGIERIQGGCPPITGLNPPSTEANDRNGLRLHLQSNSWDPDDVFYQSDIVSAQWQHWLGTPVGPPAGTYRFLGRGRRVGPVLFEIDQHHTVILRVTDRAEAEATTRCGFFVADTTPPTIIPPDPIRPLCTVAGGATPVTSESLRDFLAGDSADDLTDPAPVRLPPQVDGMEVTDDTLFPVGDITRVSFRYRDRHGNLAEAFSTVSVVRKSLMADLGLGRGVRSLRASGGWAKIRPRLATGGPCGFTLLYLVAISSDGKEAPHKLVRGAMYGSDDREFEILAAPVKMRDGSLRRRTYELTWVGVDAEGRKTWMVEKLVIEPTRPN